MAHSLHSNDYTLFQGKRNGILSAPARYGISQQCRIG